MPLLNAPDHALLIQAASTLEPIVPERRPEATRVVVAMSGGVDSSVAAALLKMAGYEVIGCTLQLYDHGATSPSKGACCAGRDIHDARNVASALDIPHYVLDYEERFRTRVIDAFAASYIAGETPVPCIACNQKVKFADLLQTARDLGAHALATGHYVASRPDGVGRALYRAADAERDQSYFLFTTTAAQAAFLRFPLGDMSKAHVRALAAASGLMVADKPDSQDICFVPQGHYSGLIERLRPEAAKPGAIVHLDGRILGRHGGIINFTIGQRKGLGIATGEPLYVVALDPGRAEVVVGPHAALLTTDVVLRDVNWICGEPREDPGGDGYAVYAQIRSTQRPALAHIIGKVEGGGTAGAVGSALHVRFAQGEYGISPGQACVFYSDASPRARMLGGGWIARAIPIPSSELCAGAHGRGVGVALAKAML